VAGASPLSVPTMNKKRPGPSSGRNACDPSGVNRSSRSTGKASYVPWRVLKCLMSRAPSRPENQRCQINDAVRTSPALNGYGPVNQSVQHLSRMGAKAAKRSSGLNTAKSPAAMAASVSTRQRQLGGFYILYYQQIAENAAHSAPSRYQACGTIKRVNHMKSPSFSTGYPVGCQA